MKEMLLLPRGPELTPNSKQGAERQDKGGFNNEGVAGNIGQEMCLLTRRS